MGRTLFEKIWHRNLISAETPEQAATLYVGLHLLHEITSPQAFALIEAKGLGVRRPELTLAMVDHCAPTERDTAGKFIFKDDATQTQIDALERYCNRYAIPCLSLDHRYQGIVHAVAPELGLSQPGTIIVCGDSHTATHGAFGAIAFGIGSSEVSHVLATQCILQRQPKNLRVYVQGALRAPATAKDLALAIVQQLGASGGKGYAIEYQGPAIEALTMEQRLTLCNMTIEAGSRFGLIAPDATTRSYLRSTPLHRPELESLHEDLYSDGDAHWHKSIELDASQVVPMMSWGTNPSMAMPIGGALPEPSGESERAARQYMGWNNSSTVQGRSVDHVFIGSCTNGRLSDLREAASIFQGHRVAAHTRCLIVPATRQIKLAAEAEGLAQIFIDAGAVWGEPSCSLCNAMNGDIVPPGELAVSTSNRNFEGRQGPGSRTILVSPGSAAQIAVEGYLI